MSKQLSDLKKGTDTFYKKVNSHMESAKKCCDEKADRESRAINDWFYGKMIAQKPLGKKFEKVLFDNLWDLYEN